MADGFICSDCQKTTSGRCARHSSEFTPGYKVEYATPPKPPFVCPVCQGRRTLPIGFYGLYDSMTSSGPPEPCRSCNGSGVIWR